MADGVEAAPIVRSPFVSCLVATTPRTGSTLLCQGLSKTGLAGHPEEYFRTEGGPSWRKRLDVPVDWSAYSSFVHGVVGRTTGGNGVFSVKVHWQQFAWLIRTLRGETSSADSDVKTVARLFPNPRYVHLRRLDKAAQALSYYRAVWSGVWSIPAEGPQPRRRGPNPPDLRQVRWFEDLVEAHEERWKAWFARHDIEPLEITYEQLCRNYVGTIGRVLDFIGVGRPPLGISPTRDLLRQGGQWSARWTATYAAKRDTLAPQPAGAAWADVDQLAAPAAVARVKSRSEPDDLPATTPPLRIVYSCVTDQPPLYNYQSLVWALTLLRLARCSPADLVVHAIRGTSRSHINRLRSLDVVVETVEPFDQRNAFANKLRQLTSPALADADCVVLCDCDLAFLGDVSPYVDPSAIGGAVVAVGHPPYAAWVRLARQTGLKGDLIAVRATNRLGWTYVNNLNGGFLIVPKEFLAPLAEAWPRWLYWILEHHETVPQHCGVIPHAFQVAFGLAALELRLPIAQLPPSINFSIVPPHRNEGIDPVVLHFHKQLTPEGLLAPTNVALTDAAVESVNGLIRQADNQAILRKSLRKWQASVTA